MTRTRRFVTDSLISMSGLLLLLVTLVSIDGRVRDQVMSVVHGSPTSQLKSTGGQIRRTVAVMYDAARDQSIEHAPMTIFAGVAIVLTVFMLRT
jgi:hypothetical protein